MSERKTFDWRRIHADLDRRLARIESTYEDNETRAQALLRERTARLAMAPRDLGGPRLQARLMVFRVGDERYGIALEGVHEICRISRVARLPGATGPVAGIINWRGEFVTVFDTARLIGLDSREPDAARFAIVLRGGEPRVGMTANGLDGMIRLDPSELQPADRLPSQRRELSKAITRDAVPVLDDKRLLGRLNEELQAV